MKEMRLFLVIILFMFAAVFAKPAYADYTYSTLKSPRLADPPNGYGINDNNIVDTYRDSSGTHGFLYNGTSYTTLNVPGASSTQVSGISSNNCSR